MPLQEFETIQVAENAGPDLQHKYFESILDDNLSDELNKDKITDMFESFQILGRNDLAIELETLLVKHVKLKVSKYI